MSLVQGQERQNNRKREREKETEGEKKDVKGQTKEKKEALWF